MARTFATRWRWTTAVVALVVVAWVTVVTSPAPLTMTLIGAVLAAAVLGALALAPARRSGVVITALLLASLVALAMVSQHRPGSLRPPQTDWLLPFLGAALAAWITAFAVRVVHAPAGGRTKLLTVAAGALVVLAVAVIAGRPSVVHPGDGRDVGIDRADLPSLSNGRRVALDCRTGLGVCTEQILLLDRNLDDVAHQLIALGWPMQAAEGYSWNSDCLPIRGIFTWSGKACVGIAKGDRFVWGSDIRPPYGSVMLTLSSIDVTGW